MVNMACLKKMHNKSSYLFSLTHLQQLLDHGQGCTGSGAYRGNAGCKGVDPGREASPSQDIIHTHVHTLIHTSGQFSIANPPSGKF